MIKFLSTGCLGSLWFYQCSLYIRHSNKLIRFPKKGRKQVKSNEARRYLMCHTNQPHYCILIPEVSYSKRPFAEKCSIITKISGETRVLRRSWGPTSSFLLYLTYRTDRYHNQYRKCLLCHSLVLFSLNVHTKGTWQYFGNTTPVDLYCTLSRFHSTVRLYPSFLRLGHLSSRFIATFDLILPSRLD